MKYKIKTKEWDYWHDYSGVVSNQPIVKCIIDKLTIKYISHFFAISINDIFISVCGNGYIDKAKMMIKYYDSEIDLYYIDANAFYMACIDCNSDMVRYLAQLGDMYDKPMFMNDEDKYDTIFVNLCSDGNLDLIKYLMNLRNKPIDLHCIIKYMMISACKYGHLNILKYFIDEQHILRDMCKTDIHNIFKTACYTRHLNIVKYFVSLFPDVYSYEINRNKITPIIWDT